MSCTSPLPAFPGNINANGNFPMVVLSRTKANLFKYSMRVPCGKCCSCRLKYSRNWAIRNMHHAEMHRPTYKEPNRGGSSFVTLTYDPKFLKSPSLIKKDFQDFMKRFRYYFPERKISYYYAGEYGSLGRPHFHALIYGKDFREDKYFWKMSNGLPLFRSPSLEKVWTFGYSSIGDVNFHSAGYVSRYIMNKWSGDIAKTKYAIIDYETGEVLLDRLPEYCNMSNGIGLSWFAKYGSHAVRSEEVHVMGKRFPPPKYYESKFELLYPDELALIKDRRVAIMKQKRIENPYEFSEERLLAKAEHVQLKYNMDFSRNLE